MGKNRQMIESKSLGNSSVNKDVQREVYADIMIFRLSRGHFPKSLTELDKMAHILNNDPF